MRAPKSKESAISPGKSAMHKYSAASETSNVVSSSFNNTFKCSLVSPASPAAEPLSTERRLHAHFSLSN